MAEDNQGSQSWVAALDKDSRARRCENCGDWRYSSGPCYVCEKQEMLRNNIRREKERHTAYINDTSSAMSHRKVYETHCEEFRRVIEVQNKLFERMAIALEKFVGLDIKVSRKR